MMTCEWIFNTELKVRRLNCYVPLDLSKQEWNIKLDIKLKIIFCLAFFKVLYENDFILIIMYTCMLCFEMIYIKIWKVGYGRSTFPPAMVNLSNLSAQINLWWNLPICGVPFNAPPPSNHT